MLPYSEGGRLVFVLSNGAVSDLQGGLRRVPFAPAIHPADRAPDRLDGGVHFEHGAVVSPALSLFLDDNGLCSVRSLVEVCHGLRRCVGCSPGVSPDLDGHVHPFVPVGFRLLPPAPRDVSEVGLPDDVHQDLITAMNVLKEGLGKADVGAQRWPLLRWRTVGDPSLRIDIPLLKAHSNK